MGKVRLGITVALSLGAVFSFGGCDEQTSDVDSDVLAATQTENGLSMNGLSMNGLSMNGLSMNGLSMNGLSMNGLSMNGLSTVDGLSTTSGLMTTSGGRDVVTYMVRCALPAGRSITKQDHTGTTYTFRGAIGVAPELENGPCGVDCQERVSACMLAHVNNAATKIDIWLDSEGAIGWGSSPTYPYQEGSFFGNLFPMGWQGFYCNGKGYDAGAVPGRLGTPLATNVYTNPYGNSVECGTSGQCNAHGADGYNSCNTTTNGVFKPWTKVVTVWRNFDVNTVYKICNWGTQKCLGLDGASTADDAAIKAQTFSNADHQKFWVLQVETGRYKVVAAHSGKVIDASGSFLKQKPYAGTAAQKAAFNTLGGTSQFGRYTIVPASGAAGFFFASNAENTVASTTTNLTSDMAKWTVVPVGSMASQGGSGSGTNPCAQFCQNPVVFNGSNYSAGNLGTGAVCRETTTNIGGGGRYNMGGRSFSINGVAMGSADGAYTLPAKVNGGYCFQATAGGYDYASFNSW